MAFVGAMLEGDGTMSQQILFIDDEVPVRLTFSFFLERNGFHVTAASSAREAVQLARANEFCLLVLDACFCESLEVFEFFKNTYPEMPVMLITPANSSPEKKRRYLDSGADASVSKADSFENWMKEVQRLCL